MAFKRGAGAERDDRKLQPVAHDDGAGDLLFAFGEDDSVRSHRRMIALVLAMLVTHGGGGGETVPEYLLQSIERCVTSGGIDGFRLYIHLGISV